MRFSKWRSLGWNCEGGLFLRDVGVPDRGGFFTWSVTPFEALCALIENEFEGCYDPDHCAVVGNMIEDQRLTIAAHHPYEPAQAVAMLANFQNDRLRRGRAFIDELRSGEPVAYLLKYEGPDAQRDAIRLRALLRDKGAPDASLLVVAQAGASESVWRLPGTVNLYVERFAPFDLIETYDFAAWSDALRGLVGPSCRPSAAA